jgi:hypothetical protein
LLFPASRLVRQRELFSAALKHIGARDLANTVVEVKYEETRIKCSEYALPEAIVALQKLYAKGGSKAAIERVGYMLHYAEIHEGTLHHVNAP